MLETPAMKLSNLDRFKEETVFELLVLLAWAQILMLLRGERALLVQAPTSGYEA